MIWKDLFSVLRSQLVDPSGVLWTDDELIAYANDAENKACRIAYLLRLSDPITLVAGTNEYAFPAKAIEVIRLRRGTERALQKKTSEWLDRIHGPNWEGTDGAPIYYARDQKRLFVKLYRTPDTLDITENTAVMTGLWSALPAAPLTKAILDAGAASPEIPEDYHLDLIHWIKYWAYLKDGLTQDQSKSDRGAAIFRTKMEKIKRDTVRYEDGGTTPLPAGGLM